MTKALIAKVDALGKELMMTHKELAESRICACGDSTDNKPICDTCKCTDDMALREVRAAGCQCSDEEACKFVQEREELRKENEQLKNDNMELNAIIEALWKIINGDEISEFEESFSIVNAVLGLRERLELSRKQARGIYNIFTRNSDELLDLRNQLATYCDDCPDEDAAEIKRLRRENAELIERSKLQLQLRTSCEEWNDKLKEENTRLKAEASAFVHPCDSAKMQAELLAQVQELKWDNERLMKQLESTERCKELATDGMRGVVWLGQTRALQKLVHDLQRQIADLKENLSTGCPCDDNTANFSDWEQDKKVKRLELENTKLKVDNNELSNQLAKARSENKRIKEEAHESGQYLSNRITTIAKERDEIRNQALEEAAIIAEQRQPMGGILSNGELIARRIRALKYTNTKTDWP